MKIRMTFKTPDVVDQAIEGVGDDEGVEVRQACKKWVKWGEYLTVEVDTEKETCEVVPA